MIIKALKQIKGTTTVIKITANLTKNLNLSTTIIMAIIIIISPITTSQNFEKIDKTKIISNKIRTINKGTRMKIKQPILIRRVSHNLKKKTKQ
jgi:hypothetical protein